jgi:uncharacterized membrane-anchored protein YhcB (DUF1043 family)
MEEMQNQDAPKMSSVEEPQEEQELNHTDKLVGLFSEPQKTFGKIAQFPVKTADWILPVLVMIVVMILGQFVMRTNAEIRQQIKEKSMQQIEKSFDDAVKKGQITRAQADEQLSTMEENMDSGSALQTISIVVGIPIGIFIVFFVIAGFYLLVAKFGLKGEGSYKDVMVASGLPYYIASLHQIVVIIASLAMSKLLTGLSIADFMGSDKTTIAGFVLGKLDVFSIWYYVVFAIALAKMNKSNDIKKYMIAVIAIWIGVSLIFFYVAKAVPVLSSLAG